MLSELNSETAMVDHPCPRRRRRPRLCYWCSEPLFVWEEVEVWWPQPGIIWMRVCVWCQFECYEERLADMETTNANLERRLAALQPCSLAALQPCSLAALAWEFPPGRDTGFRRVD